jgi:hypothetical protein
MGRDSKERQVKKEGTKLAVRSRDVVCIIDCNVLVGRAR